jgi:hypothetical protein
MTYFQIHDAPRVHIHPLPQGFQLARVQRTQLFDQGRQVLEITAWMPEGWATNTTQAHVVNEDAFREEFCEGCRFFFSIDDVALDDLDISIEYDGLDVELAQGTLRIYSPCPCHADGISSVEFPCVANHDLDDVLDLVSETSASADEVDLSYARFSIHLDPLTLHPRRSDHDYGCFFGVALQAVHSQHGLWLSTRAERAINAFGDVGGEICWGHRTAPPLNLADAAITYARTPGNGDLLSPSSHAYNVLCVNESSFDHPLSGALYAPTAPEHALLIASTDTPQTFLLLASAPGSQIVDGAATLLVSWRDDVPLPDGRTIGCWISEPFPDGTRWLAAQDPDNTQPLNGLLLGQLQLPCISTPPTSSAPAALAAT